MSMLERIARNRELVTQNPRYLSVLYGCLMRDVMMSAVKSADCWNGSVSFDACGAGRRDN